MPIVLRSLAVIVVLLIAGAAWAQEPRGYLGVEVRDISKEDADKLGWEAPRGVRVVKPREGGAAARAGLLPEDVIISLDGQEVENMQGFVASVAARGAGAQVRLRVLRAGRERTIIATLDRPPPDLAQPLPNKNDVPVLQLDTGGHMAIIRGLIFTPDGKHLISAGDDKVIRIWDWQAGKTVRTIRGQVGPGQEGKFFAIALSPDGRWLAAGGYLGSYTGAKPREDEEAHKVRLYEFATGRLVALLKGHTDVVQGLAFSPDSRWLLSTGADTVPILWDVQSRRLVHRLRGHKHFIYAAGFTPDGSRALTGSFDKTLKAWSVSDGKEIATMAAHTDKVRSLAVSPLDGTIASGSWDGEIRLWDGKTFQPLGRLATGTREVGALSFSPDGRWLVSGRGTGNGNLNVHAWDMTARQVGATYANHDDVIIASAITPDGRFAATGGGSNGGIHVWDLRTGQTKQVLNGTGSATWATGFSGDGQRLAWGHKWVQHNPAQGYGPLANALRLPRAGSTMIGRPEVLPANAVGGFLRSRPTLGDLTLAHRKSGDFGYDAILDVKRGAETLVSIQRNSTNGDQHRAYSFTPDGQTIVSGGAYGWLTSYDIKGQRIGDFVGHESDIWAVTPSHDGRLLVTGSADQTVRLWNLRTRELIVTLFYGKTGEWVMWTPQGYYTSSEGADKIVGWQINQGSDKAAEYVGAEQLRTHLHRPDIVEKAIIEASAEKAVREAPGTSFRLADLLSRPVPRFRILSPAAGTAASGGRVEIKIAIETTPDPVKSIRIQVNGRQVDEQVPGVGSGGFGAGTRSFDVPLSAGRNEVRISLTNSIGEKAQTLTLNHEGPGQLDRRGTLFILAIGVDEYQRLGNVCGENHNQSCNLRYPGADARKLVEAVERRLGPSHIDVVKRVLVNGAGERDAPTASNILDAIGLLKQARETDTVVLFIAGHGFNDGPSYRFLPTNAEWQGNELRGSTVVPWQVLQEAVEGAKGRRVLFVDTCHSGNAYNEKLGNSAYHANIIAYTAARFDQLANESAALGHGLFTYAVVEGLEGKGGLAGKRQISTKELAQYVITRVGELAREMRSEQEPQYHKGRDAEDYVLASW